MFTEKYLHNKGGGEISKTKKLIVFIYVVVMGIFKSEKVFDGIFFSSLLKIKMIFLFWSKTNYVKVKINSKTFSHAIRITKTYIVIYNSRSIKLLYYPVVGW